MIKKILLFCTVLGLLAACQKDDTLSTIADFLARDDSDTKLLREYKTWVVAEASIEVPNQPTLVYKKGQPIQGNFDPSKISFVFSSNSTYQGTDEKGKPENGVWKISEDGKKITINTSTVGGTYNILTLNKTNFDFANQETIDENNIATVTIKMVPNR
jgi:hypothetical protein